MPSRMPCISHLIPVRNGYVSIKRLGGQIGGVSSLARFHCIYIGVGVGGRRESEFNLTQADFPRETIEETHFRKRFVFKMMQGVGRKKCLGTIFLGGEFRWCGKIWRKCRKSVLQILCHFMTDM